VRKDVRDDPLLQHRSASSRDALHHLTALTKLVRALSPGAAFNSAGLGMRSTSRSRAAVSQSLGRRFSSAQMVDFAMVKKLRGATGAGISACKKAIAESDGDYDKAMQALREAGILSAAKKMGRAASQGVIHSYIHQGSKLGVMLEVNCETDFVTKTDQFKELVKNICMQIVLYPDLEFVSMEKIPAGVIAKLRKEQAEAEDLQGKPDALKAKIIEARVQKTLKSKSLLDSTCSWDEDLTVGDYIRDRISIIGENLKVPRFLRYVLGEEKDEEKNQGEEAAAEQPAEVSAEAIAPAAAASAEEVPLGAAAVVNGKPVDENGEPLSKSALKKRAKAIKSAQRKAEKAAAREAKDGGGAAASDGAEAAEEKPEPPAPYSFTEAGILMSSATPEEQKRVYSPIRDLGKAVEAGQEVWVRGRVSTVRAKGKSCFFVLRAQGQYTVQGLFLKNVFKETPKQAQEMLTSLSKVTEESIIDVRGQLVEANVTGCSQSNVEIQMMEVVVISSSVPELPFEIADAGRSEAEIVASEATDRPIARIGQDLRLNSRWIDLRVSSNAAIMRVQSAVCTLFREALLARGFMEIHSPKLIAGESEGGAEVFRTDYFGKSACLAQSPQLYKQMGISADMERVFEIGPVFRAENSNSRRHLCEFVGLDIEMAFNLHYNEVIQVLHEMFFALFEGLEERYASDLAAIREQYPSEKPLLSSSPCIVHWEDANAMLEEAGEEAPGMDDLNTQQELALGRIVREKFGTDLFFLDRYPSDIRPFYTMPCADDDRYSNSYDILLRGQEICSGAQRIHDPELLTKMIKQKGASVDSLKDYIDSMRYGMPPHGGGGIGLERLVFLYLGLDNVRKASMFPRDPSRCTP